jgi:RHS repeat-associated protein
MKKALFVHFVLMVISFGIFLDTAFAVRVTVMGPEQYARSSGPPNSYRNTFSAVPGQGSIIVRNGSYDDRNRLTGSVSSATITINGLQIYGPKDFNKNRHVLEEKTVDLQENNTLSIRLSSRPGSYLSIEIIENVQNRMPVADDQSITLTEDTAQSLTLTAFDPDNDPLTYQIITLPSAGTLSGTAPNLTYTPDSDYNGTDAFSFTVNDDQIDSEPGTIRLTIDPVNDIPTAIAGPDQTVDRTHTVSLNGSGSHDVDEEDLRYQWTIVSKPQGSQAVLSDNKSVNPTFIADMMGQYEIELMVFDETVQSTPDTVIITVTPRIIAVPLVRDLPQTDAESALSTSGLAAGTITTVNSDTVPAGTVLNQVPMEGTMVEEGSLVHLEISLGPAVLFPTVNMSASSESIYVGESTTLTWNSIDADSAFIEPDIGSVATNGSVIVSPDHTRFYTITVTGSGGSANAQLIVTVGGTTDVQPEGSFGEPYNDLIPPDATLEAYDVKRFSLITGLVENISGSPIEGVSVTVFNHPEYGTTFTDTDGRFSIPVEGGAMVTLVYQNKDYLTVHRQVQTAWNDSSIVDTIVMIAKDSTATTLTFDGNPDTVVTHHSTPVMDASGSRSCSMVFTGDNQAFLVDSLGNDVYELNTITTRATEYTTPESMPAILPPTSAFTYCAELSVEGASRVRFVKPVITWVNNFLGFDVGEVVPSGYYDRDQGVWKASDNGIVVKLLDIDLNGVVDALDATGDDIPDDLNNDGSFNDEVIGLDDETVYVPGSSFWRVPISHFTPFDFNWPWAIPEDAISPNPGEITVDQQKAENKDCENHTSSFVEERSRIFHEDIPIPGTNITLHYASNRVTDYKSVGFTVPASGDEVPESLESIIVRLEIAGQALEQILPALPNQKTSFSWNGLDYLGNPLENPTIAHIKVGFSYKMEYYKGDSDDGRIPAFTRTSSNTSYIQGRNEMIVWKFTDITVQPYNRAIEKSGGELAEGWTLSNHHYGSIIVPTLYKGDGKTVPYEAGIITTVAGNGTYGSPSDGVPATDAQLGYPLKVSSDQAGNLYIPNNSQIHKVDAEGIMTHIAGKIYGSREDGIPATEADLYWTQDVYVNPEGNLYIANTGNHIINKVDTNGIITRIAGGGINVRGYAGDGGPAIDALLYSPNSIDGDQAGNIYISDYHNRVIRKIDTNGIITTVAGNGTVGYSGDGGPATDAALNGPMDLYVNSAGDLYIADSSAMCVRKVDAGGIITTIAGTGTAGYNGDGIPATQAMIDMPYGISGDLTGNLYIAEMSGDRIRKIDPNGIITTVAGNGTSGFQGDGGPAIRALMGSPGGVSAGPDGSLYIADNVNHRIRTVRYFSIQGSTSGDMSFPEENGLGHVMSKSGRHEKTVDLNTGLILSQFEYNDDNTLMSITDPFGRQTSIQRDTNGTPTAIISPDGLVTRLTINANHHLEKVTYEDQSFFEFEYTTGGLLTAKIEPNGNRFEHVFDSQGRLTDAMDQEGGHWHYTRTTQDTGEISTQVLTAEGNLKTYLDYTDPTGAYESTITGPAGGQTFFSTSADGFSTHKSMACGMDLAVNYSIDPEYTYKYASEIHEKTPELLERVTIKNKIYEDTNLDDLPDLITETVSVNSKFATSELNTLLSTKVLTTPEGRKIHTQYDPTTLLPTSVKIFDLDTTSFEYDNLGRLTAVQTDTRRTRFAYQSQGFIESITDPENHMIRYEYDDVGRMTSMSRPDGGTLEFVYDDNSKMTLLTTPFSIDHGFGFNAVNRINSYQTPLSGSYTYGYDKDRRLTSTIFPSGESIDFIYDRTMLSRIQTPEGYIDYTYFCGSKIESITKGSESTAYAYDGKLLTSETFTGTLSQNLSYTYNNDFNLTSFAYAGQTATYTFDEDGLLTGSGNFTITRNASNGLPETVVDDNLNISQIFNGYGELNSQNVTINDHELTQWDLTRNNASKITQKSETINGTISDYDYTYDAMGRLLTVVKNNSLVEEYQYSTNGTRLYEMNLLRGNNGRTLIYSDEDHLLTAGTTTYQYGLDGFLQRKTNGTDITDYAYSLRGELLSVTLPDNTRISYVHDPMGRRIGKKVNGTITEKYLWQGLTRLLAVFDGSDNLLKRFEYADRRMPVAFTSNGVVYYLDYDQVGSLRLVADASGTVVKQIEYDTFGNIISDSNPTFDIPFGFAGGLHDRQTGLVRFGFRDYDPDVGRWTAKDPILFAGGDTDLYGYVLNDPVNLVDPTGQIAGIIIGTAAGVYGGFLSGLQSGDITNAVLSGIAGGIAGGVVGAIMPGASNAIGGTVGGAISGALGGAFGGAIGKKFADPCASVRNIANAAGKGALIGSVTGALGGALSGAAASVGMNNAAVGIATANIMAPISWGLGIDW